MGKKLAIAMIASAFIAGCSEDVSQQTAAWETLQSETTERIAGLRTSFDEARASVDGLPSFEGFEGLAARKAALVAQFGTVEEAISGAESALSSQADAVAEALAQKKIAAADAALSAARESLTGAFDSASSALEGATAEAGLMSSWGNLVTSVTELRGRAAGEHLPTQTGVHDFLDIDFQTNSANFDLENDHTAPALERLVALTSGCTTNRFSIHGHASKEGNAERNQTLSEQRAEAIKTYLLEHGVTAEQITGTVGHGSNDSAVPEPEPESPEAEAMDPGLLEAIREVNRRVSITLETACEAAAE